MNDGPAAAGASARLVLRGEGAGVLALATGLYTGTDAGWLLFALLFLAPDLFMLGYLKDTRTGAFVYNLGHTYLTPGLLALIGWTGGIGWAIPVALIWVAHIGFDRLLGYSLKYPTAFRHTHLSGRS